MDRGQNTKVKLVAVGLALVAVLVWAFFLRPDRSETAPPKDVKEIRLAAFQLYPSALIVAADQSAQIVPGRSCFADEGIKPVITKRSKGPELVDTLIGGSADFGTLAITPQVLQALQGSELVVFATIQTTDRDIKIVGRKSAGVTTPASLKGKRVGYVGGTIGEIFLDRYLKKHGLSKNDISLTSGGPPQLRDLFLAKSVDAIVIWEPTIQDILNDPAIDRNDVFVDVDNSLYTLRMNLVARPEVLRQKQDEAKRLLRSLLCAEKLLQNHPDQARRQLEVWLDRKPDTLKSVFFAETFQLQLDIPKLLDDLQKEAEWANNAIFSGKKQIPGSFSKYIESTIMESVAPERIKK